MGPGVLISYLFSPLITVEHVQFVHKKNHDCCTVDEFLTRWEKRPSQRPTDVQVHWTIDVSH